MFSALPIRQFIQERNHINVIYVANPSVTRNDVSDLRIHTVVKNYVENAVKYIKFLTLRKFNLEENYTNVLGVGKL